MNILIDPTFNGLIQTLISLIFILGLIFIGKIINNFFFKKYENILFNFFISSIFISQLLKIFSQLGYFKISNLFLSILIFLIGVFSLKNLFAFTMRINFKFFNNYYEIGIALLLFSYFIISIGPPSMADALDYHYGFPIYLIKNAEIPSVNMWLFGSLSGNGEFLNSLPIFFGSDNFGSLFQFCSLIFFLMFIKDNLKDNKKLYFITFFVITSPTLLQLISGPKFLLAPQILTASVLFILVKNKKIYLVDFVFISLLLIGATQFKLSFLMSGIFIGLFTLYKSFILEKSKIFLVSILLLTFFFVPTALWNYSQLTDFSFINIFTLVPNEMLENLNTYRENNYLFPLNLFIPQSLGTISTIIGFQILLLFLPFKKSKEFKTIMIITFLTILLHYYLGMNIGRIYFEFLLWSAIALTFIDFKKKNYTFYSKLLLPQFFIVLSFSIYFALTVLPGIFTNESRDSFMVKNSFEYQAFKWANKKLPENSKVLSNLRSVAFLENDFVSTDWLTFNIPKKNLKEYFKLIKKKEINYIILEKSSLTKHVLKKCFGKQIARSNLFNKSSRNPLNRNSKYEILIYEFNYKDLPNCV